MHLILLKILVRMVMLCLVRFRLKVLHLLSLLMFDRKEFDYGTED